MGPIPQPASSQYRPPQLDTNTNFKKDNTAEKRKRAMPTIRFRPSAAPKPSEAAACPPETVSKVLENRPPPLEKAPVHKSTLWPGAGRMSGNLFKDSNWLLPPNYLNNDSKNATSLKSPIKEEPKIGEQSIISLKAEKCGCGSNCPFCKNQNKEDWDGKYQNQLQQKTPPQPKVQRPQARHPQTLNYQKPQDTQKSNKETQIDKYLSQTKIHKQWEAEMERLNSKYNLDCFSDSELDSESDEGEQYKYEHGYETVI